MKHKTVIPAKAGIFEGKFMKIPAFAGMTALLIVFSFLPAVAEDAPAPTTEQAEQMTAPPGEAQPAHAEGDPGSHGEHGSAHAKQKWTFDGMFGTYDQASMQRGLKVYREVCSACHSLKRVYFRNLEALGYEEGQIKSIASSYTAVHGLTDEGEPNEGPALPSDHFPSPYPNDKAAAASNGGALPPDLSLIIKARHDGANYVYSLLTGYGPPPEGTTLLPGQNWNKAMPGHILAMPPPLTDGQVAYEDEAPQTVDQYARDVVNFLTWAADPYMQERKRTGIKVLIFLAVFAALMYAVKRKIWADVH